jgi:hypothetical protein
MSGHAAPLRASLAVLSSQRTGAARPAASHEVDAAEQEPRVEPVGSFGHDFGDVAPVRVSNRHDPSERSADRAADALVSDGGPLPLGGARVHTGAAAAGAARALQARAFTYGQDIYFAAGAYQPQTPAGRWLLAHEIAHTRQSLPGVVSRFDDSAPLPGGSAVATTTLDDPDAAATETLDVTEYDVELVPGSRRTKAVAAAARRRSAGYPRDGDPARAPATGEQPPDRERRDRSSGSRVEQARRSATVTGSPRAPATPAAAIKRTTTPAGSAPRLPATPTRLTPAAETATRPSTSPPRAEPEATTKPREQGAGAGAADTSRPGDAGGAGGAAAAGDDGPLRLADILDRPDEAAEAPSPAGTAQAAEPPMPAVSTAPAPSQPIPPAAESPLGAPPAATPAPESAPGTAPAAAPAPFGETRRLAVPVLPPEELESEAGAVGGEEVADPAAVAAKMEGFAAQLETALAASREAVQTKADETREVVRQQAAAARAGVRAEVRRTVAEIRSSSRTLLGELGSSVSAAIARIAGTLAARIAESSDAGVKSQNTIRDIFTGHRTTVGNVVKKATDDAETMRAAKVEAAKKQNRADITTAYRRGKDRMMSYPNTSRGAFVGGAAFDVAEGCAKEMRKQEPDIVAAINEVTAPLPQHFRDQGVAALDGFDTNLPQILGSVLSGTIRTRTDLLGRATQAYTQLAQFTKQTATEITTLADDAVQQANDFLPPAEQQIDRALGAILRSVKTDPQAAIDRAAPPVEEAIALFRSAADPDVDAAAAITGVLTAFLDECVSSTSAGIDEASEASKARFVSVQQGARRAMRGLLERTTDVWEKARAGISTTLTNVGDSSDSVMASVVKTFGDVLGETEQSIRDQLAPSIRDMQGSFDAVLRDAEHDIDSRIVDGLMKNTEALADLGAKMSEAEDEAAFEWDHPVLSALSFIAGIIVGIVKVLALVVVLIAVVIVLAEVLAVSALVAGLILLAGMAVFSISYAFGARLAAGQGFGEALGGAFVDFGKAVPGMLYDMTGIPKLKRAFSDERMSMYERGKLLGEGGTELVLAIFAVRGAAKGIASGFRKLPKIPWRRPVQVPTTPTTPRPAPAPVVEPPAPVATAPAPPPAPRPVTAPKLEPTAPVQTPTPRAGELRGLPGGNQPAPTPRPAPELRVVEGGRGGTPNVPEPAPAAPRAAPSPVTERPPTAPAESAPRPQRPKLEGLEGGNEPSATPKPQPDLRLIKGGGERPPAETPKPPPEPTPPQPQPQRAAAAAGAEGHEPVIGGTTAPQPTRPGTPSEGGMLRPGGRSSVEPRASAGTTGEPRPRPARPGSTRPSTSGGGGQRPGGPRPGRAQAQPGTGRAPGEKIELPGERPAGKVTEPPAERPTGIREPSAEPSTGRIGEPPAERPAGGIKEPGPEQPNAKLSDQPKTSEPSAQAEQAKAEVAKTEKPVEPGAPEKPSPEVVKARERLAELQKQKAVKERELSDLQAKRAKLLKDQNDAIAEMKKAANDELRAKTKAEKDAARGRALEARDRAEGLQPERDKLPSDQGLHDEIKGLKKNIEVESIKADPESRGTLPCFSAETVVQTPDGPRAIADVRVGDMIWTYDFSTRSRVVRRVLQLHRGRTRAFYGIRLRDRVVRATSQHRFWVESEGAWRTAETLTRDMMLLHMDGGMVEVLAAEREAEGDAETFNVSVEEFPMFFVGAGVLVHNQPVDVGLGGRWVVYRATNKRFPNKVYIGQTNELDAKGKPRGIIERGGEHQALAEKRLTLDAEGLKELSKTDRQFYEFMKDAEIEVQVKGMSSKAQADFIEQNNIEIERKVSGADNVMNRRNQITSEAHMKQVVEEIKADPAVKAKGYCP